MTKPTEKITLDDIARYAGVSPATVSRALSNNPSVKESTKLKILEVAKKHKYAINYGAQLLSSQKSNKIALFLPVFPLYKKGVAPLASDPFFLSLFSGILSEISRLDKELVVSTYEGRTFDKIAQAVRSKKADGIIVYGDDGKNWINDPLIEDDFPVVFWGGSRLEEFHWVGSDEVEGGKIAAQALIEAGCKNLAFIGGHASAFEAQGRLTGFKQYIESQGKTLADTHISFGTYFPQSGYSQMQALLEIDPTIDGVFAGADVLAISAMNAIKNKGLIIPDDIKIVGFDDIDSAAVSNPPLTTISQAGFDGGKVIVNRVIEVMEKSDIPDKHKCVELTLIKRETC